MRLACQLRPAGNISVTPLLPANAQASDGYAQPAYLAGQERTIAVLFADLRSFAGIAERKLPYDLVFLLNNYFETVGEAITAAGGHCHDWFGDITLSGRRIALLHGHDGKRFMQAIKSGDSSRIRRTSSGTLWLFIFTLKVITRRVWLPASARTAGCRGTSTGQ